MEITAKRKKKGKGKRSEKQVVSKEEDIDNQN